MHVPAQTNFATRRFQEQHGRPRNRGIVSPQKWQERRRKQVTRKFFVHQIQQADRGRVWPCEAASGAPRGTRCQFLHHRATSLCVARPFQKTMATCLSTAGRTLTFCLPAPPGVPIRGPISPQPQPVVLPLQFNNPARGWSLIAFVAWTIPPACGPLSRCRSHNAN